MLKIGITGQTGFIGTHLYNFLELQPEVEHISFKDEYFDYEQELENFVYQCDVIVHLAAMNRNPDQQIIYKVNINLVKKLINACEKTNSTPHILFSSSLQEKSKNLYGKSKFEGRKLFEEWAKRNNSKFTGLIIPNVFGPFGRPYYNSFIATFCHQLAHREQPEIKVDRKVKLIYVGELVKEIYKHIVIMSAEKKELTIIDEVKINHTSERKVSETLVLLKGFKNNYLEKGIIPNIDAPFERNLFNTFLCYIDHKSFFPFYLNQHTDDRGSFVEVVKLYGGGQVSFSTTVPGITRGNHYHTRKVERFVVIKGKALIKFRKIGTEEIFSFELDGENPSFVDMPIWHTHNITNIGDEELYTIFWINKHFNKADADTFYEEV